MRAWAVVSASYLFLCSRIGGYENPQSYCHGLTGNQYFMYINYYKTVIGQEPSQVSVEGGEGTLIGIMRSGIIML